MRRSNKAKAVITMTVLAITCGQVTASARETSVSSEVQQNYSVENLSRRAEEINQRLSMLMQESEVQIEHYTDVYEEIYSTDLRLQRKHITYDSRLVAKSENFIKNDISKSSFREDAYSLDLRSGSAVTAYEIDEYILKGTALAGLGKSFVRQEIKYGVNALFLLSIAIHESGWGRSAIARDKNNLFGFRAYDRSPYASATRFSSKEESIEKAAKLLAGSYLTKGARYYSGGYTAKHVNVKYASDPNWARKVTQTMNGINKTIMENQDVNYHLEIYLIGEDENGNPLYSSAFEALDQ